MKILNTIAILFATLITFTGCEAKIKNTKTATYQVNGNCGMCKKTIEKAANINAVAKGVWNKDSKIITLTFDSVKTNADAILKRVALVGYDNELFRATDEAYNKRPACCHYERKPITKIENTAEKNTEDLQSTVLIDTAKNKQMVTEKSIKERPLDIVFASYFLLKDAFVKTDAKQVSAKATILLNTINAVDMVQLSATEHEIWMKELKDLQNDVLAISKIKDIEKQRQLFSKVSNNMIALIKIAKVQIPVYVQHCPMYADGKGADWLSKEKIIKNPYYGAQMLNCGNVAETIK
jgi:Protein of unknown function (DUF3347)